MNYYPDRVYPEDPQFPVGHDDVPTGPDLYGVESSYITALAADASALFDQDGNIELGATKALEWLDVTRINLSGGEIDVAALLVNDELIVDTPTLTTLNITGDLVIANDLIVDGDARFRGVITQDYVLRETHTLTMETDPGDPLDDTAVFWFSDGNGYGDQGDFCCKITEGAVTKDFTISDYSAL